MAYGSVLGTPIFICNPRASRVSFCSGQRTQQGWNNFGASFRCGAPKQVWACSKRARHHCLVFVFGGGAQTTEPFHAKLPTQVEPRNHRGWGRELASAQRKTWPPPGCARRRFGIGLRGDIILTLYTPHVDIAFISVEHIMRDVSGGWLLRYMHANGASMFFIVVYIHMFRGLYYGSYASPREILWCIGVVIRAPWKGPKSLGVFNVATPCDFTPGVGSTSVPWRPLCGAH